MRASACPAQRSGAPEASDLGQLEPDADEGFGPRVEPVEGRAQLPEVTHPLSCGVEVREVRSVDRLDRADSEVSERRSPVVTVGRDRLGSIEPSEGPAQGLRLPSGEDRLDPSGLKAEDRHRGKGWPPQHAKCSGAWGTGR